MNLNRYKYIVEGLTTKVIIKTKATSRYDVTSRTVLIDTDKLELVKNVNITFKNYGERYVVQYYKDDQKKYNLTRLILGLTDKKIFVTFKNKDSFDFRVENLILSTQGIVGQNRTGNQKNNTSNVRGVYWNSQKSKWCGQVEHMRKNHFVGCSEDKVEIEKAVIAKRNEIHSLVSDNREEEVT